MDSFYFLVADGLSPKEAEQKLFWNFITHFLASFNILQWIFTIFSWKSPLTWMITWMCWCSQGPRCGGSWPHTVGLFQFACQGKIFIPPPGSCFCAYRHFSVLNGMSQGLRNQIIKSVRILYVKGQPYRESTKSRFPNFHFPVMAAQLHTSDVFCVSQVNSPLIQVLRKWGTVKLH